jgi:hypothetical protein
MNNTPTVDISNWGTPFACDELVEEVVLSLKNKHKCSIAVETGTMTGVTTKWFSNNFNYVYTVELDDSMYNFASQACIPYNNINFIKNDSVLALRNLLPEITNKKCLFFLDAHCHAVCPTPEELRVIKEMNIKPVIVIHDFFVPNSNFGWDIYPSFEYKWENISKLVEDIYGKDGYTYFYNKETSSTSNNRGVIFIEPKI